MLSQHTNSIPNQFPDSIEMMGKTFFVLGNYYVHSTKLLNLDMIDYCNNLKRQVSKTNLKMIEIRTGFSYIFFKIEYYPQLNNLGLAKQVTFKKDEMEVKKFTLSGLVFNCNNDSNCYSCGDLGEKRISDINKSIKDRLSKFGLTDYVLIQNQRKFYTISLEDFKKIRDCCHDIIEIKEYQSKPSQATSLQSHSTNSSLFVETTETSYNHSSHRFSSSNTDSTPAIMQRLNKLHPSNVSEKSVLQMTPLNVALDSKNLSESSAQIYTADNLWLTNALKNIVENPHTKKILSSEPDDLLKQLDRFSKKS